jgi:polyferredoxin
VLAGIVGVACVAPVHGAWVDRVVEFEPFKTAITLGFQRAWPAVAWAVGLLALSLFLYKGFCRYLCPLGAGLALLGRLRRWDWIARRMECGTPCQTCRHRCHYQAIAPEGTVDYAECFQCLDCVAIHDDPARCAPLIAQARQRVIPIRALPAQRPGRAPA